MTFLLKYDRILLSLTIGNIAMSTRLVKFDELTYPEIGALPRDVKIVLPIGGQTDLQPLIKKPGSPEEIYLLPAIPFGWTGSRVEVPPQVFQELVRNLFSNLLEDGFRNVTVAVPYKDMLDADIPQIVLADESPQTPSPTDADKGKVVILPIGHTEQHGFHAPLCTDTVIIEAISRGIVETIPEEAISLPTMPYGVSTHRRSFPGTFSVGGRAFEDYWVSVVDALVERGFQRLFLLSGHGGNGSFLVNVVKYSGERHPPIFCATTGLYLTSSKGAEALALKRESPIGGMGHAGELETSLMLALRPELVHLARAVDETDFISTPSYYMDWIEGGALTANPPWEDDTRTGAYGAGSLGTREKGEYWLKIAIEEKVDQVREIHEQYNRRGESRAARRMDPRLPPI